MNNKYIIIYHKEDNDGLFSMAIIYNYLINDLTIAKDNIIFEGHDYKSILQIDIDILQNNYTNVIITDISFPANTMKSLYNIYGENIVWFDHHAPIIKQSITDNFDEINGSRISSRSAILNAYKYFYDPFDEKYNIKDDTEDGLPEYLRILSAWDSFSYEQEGYTQDFVRNVNVATNTKYKLDPIEIIQVVYDIIYKKYASSKYSTEVKKLEESGKVINDAKDIEYAAIIKNVGDIKWTVDGRAACALFMQGATSSLIFKSIKDTIKHGIIFKRNPDGNWVMSLYNTSTEYDKEFHCGEYLKKKYHGGGHAGASGCQLSESEFIKILKRKTI